MARGRRPRGLTHLLGICHVGGKRCINTARKTIPFAQFDKTRCAQGLETLRSYRVERDDHRLQG
jgi:hypothetical protein